MNIYPPFRWLNEHARNFTDVSISNVTDEIGTLGIAGPRSREVLSKLTDTDMSHGKFKFLTVKNIEIAGIPVKAIRLSYTGTTWMSDCFKLILFILNCLLFSFVCVHRSLVRGFAQQSIAQLIGDLSNLRF